MFSLLITQNLKNLSLSNKNRNTILMFSNHKIWVSMATVLLWYLGRANNSVLSCQKLLPWALFHFFFIPDLSLSLCLLCFISSYFSLYSSTSFSLPPLTSHPLKNLAHPKLLSTILSHAGRGVTVLNMIVRWAPPFCQKLELKEWETAEFWNQTLC